MKIIIANHGTAKGLSQEHGGTVQPVNRENVREGYAVSLPVTLKEFHRNIYPVMSPDQQTAVLRRNQ